MQVRLLGPVEVRATGDESWVRPPPQQRLMLAALAAPVGRSHDAAALAEALWGGNPPDNAHRLLQVLASRLRAALGQDADDGPLVTVERGWRLELAPEHVDTARFERALERARSLAANGDVDAAGVAVDEAMSLWRGRPFGDLADESLLVAESTRLEERRLEAQQLRMQLQLASGAHAPVIAELKELLADHPLREQLWGLLMVALYQAGRQAEALVAYQRVRERLIDELGVEPGPALQRLHGQILRQDLDDRAVALAVGDAVGPIAATTRAATARTLPRPLTSFVGRQPELAALGRLLAEAPLVSVVGPGGVGKTRLALAVADAAGPGFDLGAAFVDLSRVPAELLVKAVATAVGVVELAHEPLQDTVTDHLRRGSALLVLDNCEQLREPVGELAGHLLRACPELVVLATTRERLGVAGEHIFGVGPLPVRPPGADGQSTDRPTEPGTTPGSDAARLFLERTQAVAPGFTAPLHRVEEACRRLDGLPLAIELAAARASSLGIDGLLAGLDDRLRLLQGAPGTTGRHRSLRAVLDWSHDLLDDEERRTLRRLATFTAGFDLRDATVVLAEDQDEVSTHDVHGSRVADLVGRLADKSLLTPEHGPRGSRWSWLASVRDYALRQLVTSGEAATYRRRHLRWAVDTAADLQRRMEAGDDWRTTFRDVEDDLRAALEPATGDSDTSPDHADPGVPAGNHDRAHPHPDEDRLRLAFSLAALQARTGSYTVAQQAYGTAIELARAVGGPDDLAEAALGASASGMTFGVSDKSRVAWLEEALAAQGPDPTALRVQLLARLSMELYWLVDRDRSLALVEESVATAERVGDDAAHAHALYASHYTSRGPETTQERVHLSAEIVKRAERGGATELALAGRAAHVVDLMAVGDLVGMDVALGELWEAADRFGLPAFQWYADVYRLVRALLAGHFDDADALAATSIAAGRNVAEFTVGLSFAESITDLRDLPPPARHDRAARLADLARRFPGVLAWRCLALLDELALRHPGPRTVTSPPVQAGHEAVSPLRAAAAQLVEEVLAEPRDAHWVVEACLLAEAVAELGESVLAARLEAALRPYAGSLAVAGRVAACRGGVSHALGLLELTLDDLDRAVADLQDAVAQHERLEALPHLARSLSVLAHVYERRGDAEDRATADELSRRARQIARRLLVHTMDGTSPVT